MLRRQWHWDMVYLQRHRFSTIFFHSTAALCPSVTILTSHHVVMTFIVSGASLGWKFILIFKKNVY
jgi:hypothetical protein